jgi:hypothetical protein
VQPTLKKSSRFYDFRLEIDLDVIHDDSTGHNSDSSDILSSYDLSSNGSPQSIKSASNQFNFQKILFMNETINLEKKKSLPEKETSTDLILVKAQKPHRLCQSQCFIEILKLYYRLHSDIAPYDLAKLQLLNKRCYEYFVPRAMEDLKLKLEMPPCLLSTFEPDVAAIIEEKKSEGVKIRTSQFLTLRFD